MISVGEYCYYMLCYAFFIFLNVIFNLFLNFIYPTFSANQLVGAYEGQQIRLECHSEAYPKSINYWTRDRGEIVPQGKLIFKFNIV